MAEAENLEIVLRTFMRTPESETSDEDSEAPTSQEVMYLVGQHLSRKNEKLQEYENENRALTIELATVAKELETERKEKRALEERYNSKKDEIGNHQQMNVKLRKALTSKGKEVNSLQKKVETLEMKLAGKTSEVDGWKRHYGDFKDHVGDEQTRNHNLEEKLEGEYEKNRDLLEKFGATNSLLSRERDKSAHLEDLVDGMQTEIEDLRKKLANAEMQQDLAEDDLLNIFAEKIVRSRLSTVKLVQEVKKIPMNPELEEEIQNASKIVQGLRIKCVHFLKTKQTDVASDAPATKRSRSCGEMSFDTMSTASANTFEEPEDYEFDFDN